MNSMLQKSLSRYCVLGLMVLSFASLYGCSGTKRRVPANLTPIQASVTLERAWQTGVGSSLHFDFHPIVIGNRIYTNSETGKVSAVDVATGQIQWATTVPKALTTGIGGDSRIIVVGGAKGDIFALDAQTGAPMWDTSVGTQVLTEPLVAGAVVVIRTIDNRFIRLDALSGKRIWVTVKNPSVLSLRSSYSMVSINNEVLLTGFSGGQFGMIELANGNPLWESLLAPPKGTSEIERLSDITAKPSLLGQKMCLVSYQGKIGCGDLRAAKITWAKDFSSFSGTTQSPDAVFAVNEKSHLVGFDSSSGKELWRNEKLVWRDLGEPLAIPRFVIAGDGQGFIHLFSQETGELVGREKVDGTQISAAPVIAQDLLLVQTRGGNLAAYKLK